MAKLECANLNMLVLKILFFIGLGVCDRCQERWRKNKFIILKRRVTINEQPYN